MRPFLRRLAAAAKSWNGDKAPRLGASLAYYAIFSLAPLLVVATGVVGLVLRGSQARQQVADQAGSLLGSQGGPLVSHMLTGLSRPSGNILAIIIGAVTTLLGALGIFGQLKDAFNTVLDVPPPAKGGVRGAARNYLVSFLMLLAVSLLLLVSLALSAASGSLSRLLALPLWLWHALDLVLSLGIVTVLFAALFKELPDLDIPWRRIWPSALLTAVLFTIGKFALGLYLSRGSLTSAYGAAGSLVVLLLWIYYSAQIMLYGVEYLKVSRGTARLPAEGHPSLKGPAQRLAFYSLIAAAFLFRWRARRR